jgi:hypothetical protein
MIAASDYYLFCEVSSHCAQDISKACTCRLRIAKCSLFICQQAMRYLYLQLCGAFTIYFFGLSPLALESFCSTGSDTAGSATLFNTFEATEALPTTSSNSFLVSASSF